jgi:flagellar basal body-associated protein FliL
MRQKLAKKDKEHTKAIDNNIVEELLSRVDPSELFGKNGLFEQLKKQIVEKVDSNRRNGSYEKKIIDEHSSQ